MLKNINISSGSDFSKKKFGSITKLTKPAFVHNGKVFSDNIFKNQRTIPLLENNTYYSNHGLPDQLILYDYNNPIFLNISIQSIPNNIDQYKLLSTLVTNTSVAERNNSATINVMLSNVPLFINALDPNYECDIGNTIP